MVNQMRNLLDKKDIDLAEKLIFEGGSLYIVGGAVRDTLAGRKVNDVDLMVSGISEEKFQKIEPSLKKVGKSFPVYLHNGKEIAMARKEKKESDGYKGFSFDTKDVTVKEDLKRRDLTINSMAYDIANNRLIDPFCGRKDIEDSLLVNVSESFDEDPLRVYRVARFAAQLNYRVHIHTLHKMSNLKEELYTLPGERVFKELRKALNSKFPHKFFDVLNKAGVLDVHFPEIDRLLYTPQTRKWHPEGNVFRHTMMVLDAISQLTDKEHVRFAALCHDLGKGLTPEGNLPHHYRHDHIGVDALKTLSNRIPLPNKWYNSALLSIKQHIRITKWKEMKPGKVVRLFKMIKKSPLTIRDFVDIVMADKYGRGKRTNLSLMNGIEILYNKMFVEVTGDLVDSERYSGKEFGEQLFQLRCHWLKRNR